MTISLSCTPTVSGRQTIRCHLHYSYQTWYTICMETSIDSTKHRNASKQTRIRTTTSDTDELSRFFLLVVQPHPQNLTAAVRVFGQKLIPLFAWLSHSSGKEAWKWHTALNPNPTFYSVRYSKNDELLTALQDPNFRTAFEAGFRLWREYATIFITVLAHPAIIERVADKTRTCLESNASDPAAVSKHSRSLLSLLRCPQEWRLSDHEL
jgi:hypothetical protein